MDFSSESGFVNLKAMIIDYNSISEIEMKFTLSFVAIVLMISLVLAQRPRTTSRKQSSSGMSGLLQSALFQNQLECLLPLYCFLCARQSDNKD